MKTPPAVSAVRAVAEGALPGEAVRGLLHVPEGLTLPAWAAERLGRELRAELASRSGTPLAEVSFGIVDLETTGLSAERDRILEIGLVVRRGRTITGRYSSLIDPGFRIPSVITELTGIEASLLADAPEECKALDGFARVLREQRVAVLVAHNAPFDRSFLQAAWRRGERSPDLLPFLCSLRLARRLVKAPSYGLDRLVTQLGIPRAPRHRALGDAEMTATLWGELLERSRLERVHTLEALQPLAEVKPGRRSPPRVHRVDA